MKTFIKFLLDMTGSMSVIKDETISSFNRYIEELSNENCLFSLTTFNSQNTVTSDWKKIEFVEKLNDKNYTPAYYTPLYDAIASQINSLKSIADDTDKVLFIILTDGFENASREYTKDTVCNMIKEYEGKGWTFVYLGANQDAWDVAYSLGISNKGNTMSFTYENAGQTFTSITCGTKSYLHDSNTDFFGEKVK